MADRFGEWPPRRRPPDDPFAELRAQWREFRKRLPSGFGPSPWLVLAIVVLLWGLTGIYIVSPDERGVVLRFGKVVRETGSGPHYHLPWPIETVLKPSVTQVRKEEIGFRTIAVGPPARYREVGYEALMLTGDDNIVKLEFIVQFKVRADATGATDFLFNVRDPVETVRASAEATMRQVIGRTKIDSVLTEEKEEVQVAAEEALQAVLDRYQSGLEIVTVKLQDVGPPEQVSDAFKDVISAQQDKERLINESLGYANDVVPKARGQAAQLLNEAEAYHESKVREASGDAQRFVALHDAYMQAKDVTRRRLYLEAMEEVLPRVNKIVIDRSAAGQVVPYLPLDRLLPRPPRPASEAGGAAAEGR